MAIVTIMTRETAFPRPDAVLYSFETDMNEHMPRKLDRIMLLVRIEAKKMTIGLMAGLSGIAKASSLSV
jgi:hypothetical protein